MARVVGSRSYTGAHFRDLLLCGAGVRALSAPSAAATSWLRVDPARSERAQPGSCGESCRSVSGAQAALGEPPLAAVGASPVECCVASRGTGSRAAWPQATATGSVSEQNRERVPHPQHGNVMEGLAAASWARGICAVRGRERTVSTSRRSRVLPGGGSMPHGAAWCGVTRDAGLLSDSRVNARISPRGGFAAYVYYGRPREAMRVSETLPSTLMVTKEGGDRCAEQIVVVSERVTKSKNVFSWENLWLDKNVARKKQFRKYDTRYPTAPMCSGRITVTQRAEISSIVKTQLSAIRPNPPVSLALELKSTWNTLVLQSLYTGNNTEHSEQTMYMDFGLVKTGNGIKIVNEGGGEWRQQGARAGVAAVAGGGAVSGEAAADEAVVSSDEGRAWGDSTSSREQGQEQGRRTTSDGAYWRQKRRRSGREAAAAGRFQAPADAIRVRGRPPASRRVTAGAPARIEWRSGVDDDERRRRTTSILPMGGPEKSFRGAAGAEQLLRALTAATRSPPAVIGNSNQPNSKPKVDGTHTLFLLSPLISPLRSCILWLPTVRSAHCWAFTISHTAIVWWPPHRHGCSAGGIKNINLSSPTSL
ncbi:hypothetical protein B0H11DRAFT_2202283 [Mycena galericulata]|nr:hypothetical protein B0H11DRAFT_2202283 [Mycena galericulata]